MTKKMTVQEKRKLEKEQKKEIEGKKKLQKHITDFRKKNIPERYNQIKLMDFLTDDEVDYYVSISNRSDGKTYNHFNVLLDIAIEFDFGLTFIVRKYTVRYAIQVLLQKIIDENYNYNDFAFMRTEHYTILVYKDREIAIITDLNAATDLKYHSNYLQDFPIIIYDEFLAIEGDYLPDEWIRFKTIYSSINRKEPIPILHYPKVILLGNAVNFSSPLLANLNLFNILEKHEMNTHKKYDNIVLEFNRNEQANEMRNLRAFKEELDSMTHGEFEVNNHNVATDNDRKRINKNPAYVYIKLEEQYLKITYNVDTFESLLSIIYYSEDYTFNKYLKDNKNTSTYLRDSFYNSRHEKKYDRDLYLFDNNYTKDFILSENDDLYALKINKIIGEHYSLNQEKSNFDRKEEQYKENYFENTKKSLHKRFFQ